MCEFVSTDKKKNRSNLSEQESDIRDSMTDSTQNYMLKILSHFWH